MNRAEKDLEIERLRESFAKSQIALCADYRGLSVMQMTELRSSLKGVGSYGKVVKNTLTKIAVEKVYREEAESDEVDRFLGVLDGPNLVVFSDDDPVSPAKVITDFAKKNQALEIKGGWLDGAFVDVEGVKALSSMPSREELLAKLLNLMNAPATQLLRLMNAPAGQVVQVLEAHRSNLEQQS